MKTDSEIKEAVKTGYTVLEEVERQQGKSYPISNDLCFMCQLSTKGHRKADGTE